jgi:hypothetical protein
MYMSGIDPDPDSTNGVDPTRSEQWSLAKNSILQVYANSIILEASRKKK